LENRFAFGDVTAKNIVAPSFQSRFILLFCQWWSISRLDTGL